LKQLILSDNYRLNVEIEKSPILNRPDLLTFKTNIATVAHNDLDSSVGFVEKTLLFFFSRTSPNLIGPIVGSVRHRGGRGADWPEDLRRHHELPELRLRSYCQSLSRLRNTETSKTTGT
jgi:hypothetical protein